ncbi:MAG: M24 family metallopeptidase [Candidatus Diapherotrites archaeon]
MKTEKLASIKKACALTDKLFSEILANFSGFRTEQDIGLFVSHWVHGKGLRLSFAPIIATAGNASNPHHKPKKTRLKKGFLVIDIGVKVNGYCADLTRTVFLGKASQKEKQLYSLVLNAQEKSAKKIRAGVKGKEMKAFAEKLLGAYAKLFVHGLGHGLGKKVHVKPYMKKKSRGRIRAGDIITIEPGIYKKKKFGIRIEDDYLVKKNGVQQLTKSQKKLMELPVPA